jgi:hypothetical protein
VHLTLAHSSTEELTRIRTVLRLYWLCKPTLESGIGIDLSRIHESVCALLSVKARDVARYSRYRRCCAHQVRATQRDRRRTPRARHPSRPRVPGRSATFAPLRVHESNAPRDFHSRLLYDKDRVLPCVPLHRSTGRRNLDLHESVSERPAASAQERQRRWLLPASSTPDGTPVSGCTPVHTWPSETSRPKRVR